MQREVSLFSSQEYGIISSPVVIDHNGKATLFVCGQTISAFIMSIRPNTSLPPIQDMPPPGGFAKVSFQRMDD